MEQVQFRSIYARNKQLGTVQREAIKTLTQCFESDFHNRIVNRKQPPKAAFTELNEYWRSLANEFHELNPDGFSRFIRRHDTFREHASEFVEVS